MVVDEQRQGDVAVLSVQGRLDSNMSNALDEKAIYEDRQAAVSAMA